MADGTCSSAQLMVDHQNLKPLADCHSSCSHVYLPCMKLPRCHRCLAGPPHWHICFALHITCCLMFKHLHHVPHCILGKFTEGRSSDRASLQTGLSLCSQTPMQRAAVGVENPSTPDHSAWSALRAFQASTIQTGSASGVVR